MSTVKNKEVSKTKKINSIIKFNIMAIILIAIFCIALTPVTLQNDTFYTIKIGEHIVKDGIDMQDPFSWHENLAYTYPHWAYDVITYFIYKSNEFSFNKKSTIPIVVIPFSSCLIGALCLTTNIFLNESFIKDKDFVS